MVLLLLLLLLLLPFLLLLFLLPTKRIIFLLPKMTILVRSTSLIRGKVNVQTNDVYASPSTTTKTMTRRRTVSSTSSTVTSTRTLSLQQQQQQLLLGSEANLLTPQHELQGVLEMTQHHLTDAEMEQLSDPQMPVRFYRAAKGHVETAVQQLRHALQWRHAFGVHALCQAMQQHAELAQTLRHENATGKIYVRGYDAQGRALVYMRPARENTHHEPDQMRHLVWNLEKAIACTRRESLQRHGTQALEKIILLIDYEGFALTNAPPLSTTKATLHILQRMYPERMYRAYCLHPPFIFRAFWNMVRPFVDPVTKEKIVFVRPKSTQEQQLWSLMRDREKDLETGAGGRLSPDDFDSLTYLHLPFDQAYPTTTTTI